MNEYIIYRRLDKFSSCFDPFTVPFEADLVTAIDLMYQIAALFPKSSFGLSHPNTNGWIAVSWLQTQTGRLTSKKSNLRK